MAVKIGIIGTGNMGGNHASKLAAMPDATLVSVFDIIPDRAVAVQRKHDVQYVAKDYNQLLDQVDAVVIATPDAEHAPMTLKALATGKHVLCEKPLTHTFEAAGQVITAARKASAAGQINMVNFSYRSSAAILEAMRLAKNGELGEIREVHSCYLQSWLASRPKWNPSEDWQSSTLSWRLSKSKGSGGVLYDIGCHMLDFTTACSEDLAAVRCDLRTYPKILPDGKTITRFEGVELDANDIAFITLRLKSGGIGIAHASRWATGYSNTIRLEVHGTLGAIRLDLDRSYEAIDFCLGEARQRQTWDTKYLPAAPSVLQRFVTAVGTGTPDQPDLLRGAQIQSYLHACDQSAATGQWQEIPA